jgi:hypothetical protein
MVSAIASAWAALACYITMVILGYFIGQRYYPVDYPVVRILGYLFVTLILALGALYLRTVLGAGIGYFALVTSCIFAFMMAAIKLDWKGLSN